MWFSCGGKWDQNEKEELEHSSAKLFILIIKAILDEIDDFGFTRVVFCLVLWEGWHKVDFASHLYTYF
jgi:hypothetical protein